MTKQSTYKVELAISEQTMTMLAAVAAWRKVTVNELAAAYIEDWLDIDYPESQGRLTRRGVYRDGPIGLDQQTQMETSRNWVSELGLGTDPIVDRTVR
jgi:hypothetical protein